jgi:uncharacterized damage-inducible protein DinB
MSAARPEMTLLRRYAVAKLREYADQIARCAALLTPEQCWRRPNEHSNAVGNLVLHLCGNVTQWILCGLGGRTIPRDRAAEFAQREPLPPAPLMRRLREAIDAAVAVVEGLPDGRWGEPVTIQGYKTTVLAAVFHVVEHFAFHTGQIVWATKAMLDVDLSLYDVNGRRLDGRADGIP